MDPIAEYVQNRGDFVSGLTNAGPWIESYPVRDQANFTRTRDLMLRGSVREALYLHERAWQDRRYGSLSEAIGVDDLPVLLAATIRTRMMGTYGTVPAPWIPLVRTDSFPDLEVWNSIDVNIETDDQRGNASPNNLIPQVKEYGMYDEAYASEIQEIAQLKTFGITWSVTRRMLLADNLRTIGQFADKIGIAMKRTINWHFVNLLEDSSSTTVSGPLMKDGVRFLSTATHGNLHSAALPLTAANLAAEVILFGAQTDRQGITNDRNGIKPKYLVIPPALEQAAWDIVSPAARITGASVTITSDNYLKFIVPIVIPELTSSKDWYLCADPTMYPGAVYGTLNGNQTPEYFTQLANTDLSQADGTKQKIRYDFAFFPEQWHTWRRIDDTT